MANESGRKKKNKEPNENKPNGKHECFITAWGIRGLILGNGIDFFITGFVLSEAKKRLPLQSHVT